MEITDDMINAAMTAWEKRHEKPARGGSYQVILDRDKNGQMWGDFRAALEAALSLQPVT